MLPPFAEMHYQPNYFVRLFFYETAQMPQLDQVHDHAFLSVQKIYYNVTMLLKSTR